MYMYMPEQVLGWIVPIDLGLHAWLYTWKINYLAEFLYRKIQHCSYRWCKCWWCRGTTRCLDHNIDNLLHLSQVQEKTQERSPYA